MDKKEYSLPSTKVTGYCKKKNLIQRKDITGNKYNAEKYSEQGDFTRVYFI